MAAEYAADPAGLPRSSVSCKLCVLARHRSGREIMLETQRRFDLDRSTERH